MEDRTQNDTGRSPLGTLALLALTFFLGYVVGSRTGEETGEWREMAGEPTEIIIDGNDDEGTEQETEE